MVVPLSVVVVVTVVLNVVVVVSEAVVGPSRVREEAGGLLVIG